MAMSSCGSTRPRSAAPTCTFSRATCPRSTRAGSWVTRPSGRSMRSATACSTLAPGDRVLVSCISACGTCRFCREGRYGQCLGGGGWILGHTIDGTQAEYVRVPFADTSTYPDSGRRGRRGDPHAGRHPADRLRGRRAGRRRPPGRRRRRRRRRPGRPVRDRRRAAVQPEPHRRHRLVRRPAGRGQALRRRRHRQQLPRGPAGRHQGPDRAARRGRVDRGRRHPATFELAVKLVRPGGRIANIGVHGAAGHAAPGRRSGSGTSPSPPAWWTPTPPRP